MDTTKHPFRIQVFGESQTVKVKRVKGRKREYVTEVSRNGYGFDLWNPDAATAEREGRPGFGSFAWYGMSVARRAALDALSQPEIQQVAIKTNQGKRIVTLYKSNWVDYVGQYRLFA